MKILKKYEEILFQLQKSVRSKNIFQEFYPYFQFRISSELP